MPNKSSDTGYEKKDANICGILVFMALLIVSCVLAYGIVRWSFARFERRARLVDELMARADVLPSASKPAVYFPYPREQPAPAEDLAAFCARENAELNAYGWVDRQAGIVRIPVSRAMDLIGERGLPVRGATNQSAGMSGLQLQQQRPREATQ